MSFLSVTRSLVSNTNPTEAQFDTMRTDLLNYFNGTNMDQNNIAAGGMLYSSLTNPVANDQVIKWTSSHATIKYDSAADKFKLQNTQGDILWAHRTGSTLTEFMSVRYSDGAIEVFGVPTYNESLGSQVFQLMSQISRYRKPRLVYTDDNIITLEENSSTSGEYLVMGRDRLLKVVDPTLSLAVEANGYAAGHTGAAVSGRLVAEARTANRWYYIYCVRVQGGTDSDGINAILVATTVSPETANIATHNTNFGTDQWTYMGIIRNGYNDGTNTNIIVPFIYDEGGYLRFTQGTVDNQAYGVVLASATGTTVNLEYDLVIGNAAAATVPPVATRAVFTGNRQSHGFEFHYREIASLENHALTSGCYHVSELPTLIPILHLEVPILSGYRVVVVMGNVATDKKICLAGLLDHYA